MTATFEDSEGNQTTIVLRRDAANRNLFEARESNLSAGDYQVRLATPVLDKQPPGRQFSIESHTSEQATMQMNASDLAEAARITGGRFYTIASAARLPRDLPNGEHVHIESLPPEPIWNSSWLAGLFIALIATEWILRKRAGLL